MFYHSISELTITSAFTFSRSLIFTKDFLTYMPKREAVEAL
jgi:hypothetical protein